MGGDLIRGSNAMDKMTDLQKLKEVLDNQAERGIKELGYDRLAYTMEGKDMLYISSLRIGFVFTKGGRLLGIYNNQGR